MSQSGHWCAEYKCGSVLVEVMQSRWPSLNPKNLDDHEAVPKVSFSEATHAGTTTGRHDLPYSANIVWLSMFASTHSLNELT